MMNETSRWYIAGLFGLWVYIFARLGVIGLDRIKRNNAFIWELIEYDEL